MTTYHMKENPVREIIGPLDSPQYVPTLLNGIQRAEEGWYLIQEPAELCPVDQFNNPVIHYEPIDPITFAEEWVIEDEAPDVKE